MVDYVMKAEHAVFTHTGMALGVGAGGSGEIIVMIDPVHDNGCPNDDDVARDGDSDPVAQKSSAPITVADDPAEVVAEDQPTVTMDKGAEGEEGGK